MNCSFLLFCFLSWIREDRSEKWDEENSCCMHWGCDTHENSWNLCQTPRGGSLEHKAWVLLCFTAALSSNPQHTPSKVLYSTKPCSLEEWHCSPNPISPDFDPKKKENFPRGGELVERGAGKSRQDEPAVGFPLDSCSWEPRAPSQVPAAWAMDKSHCSPCQQGWNGVISGNLEGKHSVERAGNNEQTWYWSVQALFYI